MRLNLLADVIDKHVETHENDVGSTSWMERNLIIMDLLSHLSTIVREWHKQSEQEEQYR